MEFRLFGIPIRVNPFFLLLAAYIGYVNRPDGADEIAALAVTVPLVFAAVLAHELGHAFAGRVFGLTPRIDLHGFGGLTSWSGAARRLSPWRSMLVSFAGPLVGIAFGVPALVWWIVAEPPGALAVFALEMFVFVNLGWGVLNLVPMMPLDGGNIMAAFFELFAEGKGRIAARWVSLLVSGAILAWAFTTMNIWILVLVGFMAWSNWRALQAERTLSDDLPLLDELGEIQRAHDRGDADEVIARAEALRARARTPVVRAQLQNLLAWGQYVRGDVGAALAALEEMPPGHAPDPAIHGAVLLHLGHAEQAIDPLEAALAGGSRFVEEKLARALIAAGRFDRAVTIFSANRVSADVVAAVRDAARAVGRDDEAVRLDEVLRAAKPPS